ncbi:MAG: acyl-CoA thioesterase [Polyangiales bacterium]
MNDGGSALSPEFRLTITPTAADIDELGHVSNVVYVRWIQDAAKGHSAAAGWPHDAYVKLGAVFVVHKHLIEYRAPAYAGDVLEAITFIATWAAATSERRTRIVRVADGKELVRAVTTWAFVATDTGRPRRIAPEIVTSFAQPLA